MGLNNGTESAKSEILRPAVSRWLDAFRQNKDQYSSEERVAGVVHFLPKAHAECSPAETAERICQLQQQITEVEADCSKWSDRCENLASAVCRAQEKCDQAVERLSVTGESVPQAGTYGLSTLQNSYRNFALAFELQQNKLEHAMQKLTRSKNRHVHLCAELHALAGDLRSDDQDFRHAA